MTPTSHGNCVRIPERQVSALEALKSRLGDDVAYVVPVDQEGRVISFTLLHNLPVDAEIGEPHGLRLNGYDAGEGWCMYGDGGAKQVSNQIAARDSWDGIQSYLYTEEGCHNLEARIACLVDEPTSDGSDAGRRPG
ncbi:hypothetical protein PF008_g710 [Phytophthora fragariae]|uniref:Uncharacterized protein n=1 Tax=Phytophthora fragariae TaxID=53985 RepID=A0A6G0SPA0_9STRA|nr:hypothetical protein PF008_g710 [Phytophthora fragariae]